MGLKTFVLQSIFYTFYEWLKKDEVVWSYQRWFSRQSVIGLDISSTAVKLLQLSQRGGQYCVDAYGVVPLPANTIVEGTIKDVVSLGDCISKVITRAKASVQKTVVAVPDSAVIRKFLKLDKGLSDLDMEQQVLIQAEKYIPYPIEEVNFDFEAQPGLTHSEYDDVVLVACHTENILARIEALASGGITAEIVDVESFAIQRACQFIVEKTLSQEDATITVVDIGAELTSITVLENMQVIFTRDEMFGGSQLTKDIQSHYGLTFQEAGRAKKTGDLPDDYETEVLTPFKELAVLQIRRALQFFFSMHENSKISQIILVGGTSSIAGLPELVQEQIGIPTALANPFSNMAVGDNVDADRLSRDAPAMTACCGLALRGFVT